MSLTMLHYYFLKNIVNNLSNPIKEKFEYTNDLLFNLSTFNDLGIYYKLFNPIKKDKYRLDDKLHQESFNDFILECISICKKNNDNNQLLFIYAMIAHNILEKHINTYLSIRTTKKLNYDTLCNMIDFYYTQANDSLDLTKTPLTNYFPNGFIYHDFMDNLIHKPFIKIYKFFCSKEYYTKCMKRKHFFFNHCNRSKTKLKLIFYKLYDILLNHRGKPKASNYLYTNRVNTSIFNLTKKPYLIGEETFTYSLDEVINNAYKETKEFIDAINSYLFYDNDKAYRKIYNIDKNEKL